MTQQRTAQTFVREEEPHLPVAPQQIAHNEMPNQRIIVEVHNISTFYLDAQAVMLQRHVGRQGLRLVESLARPPFAITHAPGRMLVTDLKNAQLAAG